MVTGFSNTLANLPGVLSPLLAVAIVRRTGSWVPYFVSSAAVELLAGACFSRSCTLTPVRELLDKREAAPT
jgi:hypothetical protein